MFEKARRELVLLVIIVLLILLSAVVAAMYFSMSSSIRQEINDELTGGAEIILQGVRSGNITLSSPISIREEEEEQEEEHRREGPDERTRLAITGVVYNIVDSNGKLLGTSSRQVSGIPDLSVLPQVLANQRVFKDIELPGDIPVRLYSVPIRTTTGIAGMLQVVIDLSPHQRQLNNLLVTTGIVSVIGLGLAIIAAIVLTYRALVPVRHSLERQREFVADASHELRTPLALIRANAEVVLRHKNQTIAENVQYLEDIGRETDYLGQMVGDLLTLARADMGKDELKTEPVELGKLSAEVARQMTRLAHEKGLDFIYEGPEHGHEIWLMADLLRLRQLLVILLDNAVKYTSSGFVKLKIGIVHHKHTIIEVSDSGIGIPADKVDLIFERFYRVDKARSRQEGGFGLGLSIARWIVQTHDGSIKVTSQPGKGATFSVSIPTHIPPRLSHS
jgi:signal transduction histidine kinase